MQALVGGFKQERAPPFPNGHREGGARTSVFNFHYSKSRVPKLKIEALARFTCEVQQRLEEHQRYAVIRIEWLPEIYLHDCASGRLTVPLTRTPQGGVSGGAAGSTHLQLCNTTGRCLAYSEKFLSVVKIANRWRAATAQIKKSVFEPWIPLPRHRLKNRAAIT